jgi:uncharacterized protein
VSWLFASDLHGRLDRYLKLLAAVEAERPEALLLGGDLLPPIGGSETGDFLLGWLQPRLAALRDRLGSAYPQVLAIFGNDDPRCELESLLELEAAGLLRHAHGARLAVGEFTVCGYACVPPTPFQLKDWERYDVSRYVDPGCVSPEEGRRSVPCDELEVKWGTIASDLARLALPDADVSRTVFLFHSPPHGTALDRAALAGRTFEHVPLDPHIGSIAIRRFIEARQPLLTLHGHVHESARLSGSWRERLGRTLCLSAAHDGDELALVSFVPQRPDEATRLLL